jgi:4-amino-4-deoxy-L-arabinose transferase-like glycosyltransferase
MTAKRAWLGVPAAGALTAVFLALALGSVLGQDPTYDEAHYFGVGRTILATGAWTPEGGQRQPPLSFYVNSLPLLFVDRPVEPPGGGQLLACRAASLFVFGVPLLLVIFLWARDLFGTEAGLMALALGAFSPTLLAHAGLITPDLPVTATGFVATYLCWRYHRERGWRLHLAWTVMLGLALLAKTEAWIIFLGTSALGVLEAVARQRSWNLTLLLAGLLGAVLLLNLGYGFKGLLDFDGKAALIAGAHDRPLIRAAASASAPFLPLPYLQTAAAQMKVFQSGWPAFLMREYSRTGWWYYYLVALLLKETVPMLLLLLAGALSSLRVRARGLDEVWLVAPPALVFAAFSFFGRVNIGLRYVLPAFPFLFVSAFFWMSPRSPYSAPQ